MADPPLPLAGPSLEQRLFPTLTAAQIAAIAAHGRQRPIARGDLLVDVGDKGVPFFVVVTGEIQILRPSGASETVVVTHRAGQFSGETNMLTGRPSLARARVSEPGEVIELERDELRSLVQTDLELSEILMRAFILRRSEFIEQGYGDVVVIGSAHCAGTLRVKEFLRNPSNQQIADCLGLNDPIDQTQIRDVIIVGAGPARCFANRELNLARR